jgi:hypothetical protein
MFSCVLNFPLAFFSPPFCWTLSCLIYCLGNCRGCEVNSLLTNIQTLLVRRPLKMRSRRVSGHHRQVSSTHPPRSILPPWLFSFLRSLFSEWCLTAQHEGCLDFFICVCAFLGRSTAFFHRECVFVLFVLRGRYFGIKSVHAWTRIAWRCCVRDRESYGDEFVAPTFAELQIRLAFYEPLNKRKMLW